MKRRFANKALKNTEFSIFIRNLGYQALQIQNFVLYKAYYAFLNIQGSSAPAAPQARRYTLIVAHSASAPFTGDARAS